MQSKSRRLNREERKRLIDEYEASGMSLKNYAQANGIARSTLYYWFSQLGMRHIRRVLSHLLK